METTASTYPRKVEPVSPIKILTGFVLWAESRYRPPARQAISTATAGSATVRAMTSTVMELMVDTPQASPSQTVDQIDRIGHRHDPDHRDRIGRQPSSQ